MRFSRSRLFDEITGILRDIVRADDRWADSVTPDARLEGDLRLDSIEMAALGERLAGSYGDGVDLLGFLAGLELDQIIGLTMGELTEYVAAHRNPGTENGPDR